MIQDLDEKEIQHELDRNWLFMCHRNVLWARTMKHFQEVGLNQCKFTKGDERAVSVLIRNKTTTPSSPSPHKNDGETGSIQLEQSILCTLSLFDVTLNWITWR